MRHTPILWMLLCGFLVSLPVCDARDVVSAPMCVIAQAGQGGGQTSDVEDLQPDVTEEASGLAEEGRELAQETEEKLSTLTDRVRDAVDWFAASPYLGWVALALGAFFSLVLLFAGLALLRRYFVSFVTVVGAASGAFIGSSLLMSLSPDASAGVKFVASLVGALLSGGVCVFCALRAKPMASFLVVIFPFLIISTSLA